MEDEKSGPHRFAKGNIHGKGRPKGARNKIGADLIDAMDRITSDPALAEAHVMRLYNDFPESFAKLWALIGIPKESLAKVQVQTQPSVLTADEMAVMRDVVQAIRRAAPGVGQEAVIGSLERWLAAEHVASLPMVEEVPPLPAPSEQPLAIDVLPACPVPVPIESE